jgi:hypothetical protein
VGSCASCPRGGGLPRADEFLLRSPCIASHSTVSQDDLHSRLFRERFGSSADYHIPFSQTVMPIEMSDARDMVHSELMTPTEC